jgi:hypothetical protein
MVHENDNATAFVRQFPETAGGAEGSGALRGEPDFGAQQLFLETAIVKGSGPSARP